MAHEGSEQLELERRELNLSFADLHGALREVDREVAVGVGRLILAAGARPAQERLHARDELLSAERLHDIVVRARGEAAHPLELGIAGRQHQHRAVAEIADPRERLPAVERGHRHVQDDEIRRRREELAQARAAVRRLANLVSGPGQQRPDEAANVFVVVDHEDSRAAHTDFIPFAVRT